MVHLRSKASVLALSILVVAGAAHAQATRTWVSGVGDDVNPCSRTAPCKTWAGAISKTASGGIIDALDPGGFGAVTITKPMTLEGNGTLASTLHSGTNGIIINITSGANRDVVLRNILIDGSGVTLGLNGIRFLAGDSLLVEHCSIEQSSGNGIDFEPNDSLNGSVGRLVVRDSTIVQMGTTGILIKPGGNVAAGRASIHDTLVATSAVGIRAEDKANVSIIHSNISTNTGDGVVSFAATGTGTVVLVNQSEIASNSGTGLKTNGGPAIIRVAGCVISGNATGLDHSLGGELSTYTNNVLTGNSSNGTFTGNTVPGLQ